jgi:chromate transporter
MSTPDADRDPAPPSYAEATRTWAYIGLNSFGGPAGQIAVMHRVLVDEKRWISEQRFLHALNYCMLLPGPEAQQLAVYVGWLLHGVRGGLTAGSLFVLPGVITILLLSYLYAGFQQVALVQALFFGLKAAVLAIVVEAVLRIGRRALKGRALVGLAAAAFTALFFFDVPFPLVIVGAGLCGFALERAGLLTLPAGDTTTGDSAVVDVLLSDPNRAAPTHRQTLRTAAYCAVAWLAPIAVLAACLGTTSVYYEIATFFSQAAIVTFGGAYAVLAYIAQEAVHTHGWLRPGEMLDGLALAETTPGPLIMVVQFVGFMAAFRQPGELAPLLAGTLGALLTTWVTFAPCFLWIFLGAPYVEALRNNRAVRGILTAITAAVVGVILNLAVWFALHTLFAQVDEIHHYGLRLLLPNPATLDPIALLLTTAALIATFRYHLGLLKLLAATALAGLATHLLFP